MAVFSFKILTKTVLAFSLPFAVAASAAAAGLESYATVSANGNDGTTDTVSGPNASKSRTYTGADGHAEAWATCEAGKIHSFANVYAKVPTTKPTNEMYAAASAGFSDEIHVDGPLGEMTTITMMMEIDGYLRVSDGEFAYADVSATWGAPGYGITSFESYSDTGINNQTSVQFDVFNGTDFFVIGSVGVTARATAGPLTNDLNAQSDFSNTAHFYMDSSNPDVKLIGSSGFNYSRPVPEPASFLALGVGAMGVLRRRRKA